MCVPDRMHHANLGLFQYQLRFTVELLGSGLIKILEERLSQIKFLKMDLKDLIG